MGGGREQLESEPALLVLCIYKEDELMTCSVPLVESGVHHSVQK